MESIGIIGSGRVGGALGLALNRRGRRVFFYDIDWKQLERFPQGFTTSNMEYLTERCNTLFITVPTEALPTGECDTRILISVVTELANLRYAGRIIQVSTCPPGTAREMTGILGKPERYFVHPSFYSMARMDYDAEHPVKILLGSYEGRPDPVVTGLFTDFDGPMFWNTWETIELAKYADNALSALLISYWNQVFLLAKEIGVDSDLVARTVDMDPLYRSVYRFHQKSYGGFCLPKDLLALIRWAEKKKLDAPLLKAAHTVNEWMKREYGVNERHLVYRP